ncbi:MAG: response regulator, partial [Microcystis panniformis]
AESALEFLSDDAIDIDVILLDLNLERSNSEASTKYLSGLELCQQLKTKYPDLPILLLSSPQPTELVAIALRAGVEGYCLKGTQPEELLIAIRQVAAGDLYLGDRDSLQISQTKQPINLPDTPVSVVAIIRHNFYLTGLQRIDRALYELKSNLEGVNPQQLSDRLTQLVLAGQVRELKAARWLIHQLWKPSKRPHILSQSNDVSPNNLTNDFSVEVANPQVESGITKESNILAIQASL